jgi:hypothetical protein
VKRKWEEKETQEANPKEEERTNKEKEKGNEKEERSTHPRRLRIAQITLHHPHLIKQNITPPNQRLSFLWPKAALPSITSPRTPINTIGTTSLITPITSAPCGRRPRPGMLRNMLIQHLIRMTHPRIDELFPVLAREVTVFCDFRGEDEREGAGGADE